jgi:hypothetical protein
MAASSAPEAVELSTLSAYELGQMLNDIDMQHGLFSQVAVDAERALGNAESQVIRNPEDRETRALARQLRGNLNAAKIQLAYLNKRQGRIQSLLRSMGPAPT